LVCLVFCRYEFRMRASENATAFSQVLRYRNLRFAPTRRKTKVQNLPPATKLRNAGILVIPAFFRV